MPIAQTRHYVAHYQTHTDNPTAKQPDIFSKTGVQIIKKTIYQQDAQCEPGLKF